PIRELLDTGLQSDTSSDDGRWAASMKEEILAAELQLTAELAHVKYSLRKILNFKVGDILPIEMPKTVAVKAENIPIFNASFGEHKDKVALKIIDFIEHPKDTTPQYHLQKSKKQ